MQNDNDFRLFTSSSHLFPYNNYNLSRHIAVKDTKMSGGMPCFTVRKSFGKLTYKKRGSKRKKDREKWTSSGFLYPFTIVIQRPKSTFLRCNFYIHNDLTLCISHAQSNLKLISPSLRTSFALKRFPFLDTKSVSTVVSPVASRRAASDIGISRRQMLTPILKPQPSE